MRHMRKFRAINAKYSPIEKYYANPCVPVSYNDRNADSTIKPTKRMMPAAEIGKRYRRQNAFFLSISRKTCKILPSLCDHRAEDV